MKSIRNAATMFAAATLAASGLIAAAGSADATTVHACGNKSLSVSMTQTEGATGHGSLLVRFKNVTRSSCTLHGYPGFDALTKTGHVLKHAKRTLNGFTGGAHSVKTITVKPGKYASADVEWLNFNPKTAGSCAFSKTVATTPANTSDTRHFLRSVSACDLQVHPTVAGTTGNG